MSAWLGITVVVALVAANAFFVAAEFALVASRRAAIEERAEEGSRRARAALGTMRNLSFTLSGAQLGITLSSLVLGYVAEGAFAQVLDPVIDLFGLPEQTALGVSLLVALTVSTLFQMVVGELAPKNIAIALPERTSLALALPMRAYTIAFGWMIRLFDTSANAATRLLGFEPQEELLGAYTPDELARIVQASSAEGELTDDQAELLIRAVELGERRVSEVMVPRPDVVWLRAHEPVDALRTAARDTGHSRFPVQGETDEDLVGTVHVKDLLRLPTGPAGMTVGDLADDALIVPESHTLRRLLADLRQRQRTFAAVVDEYGGVAGIVTLEDVLEELVGEIEDEFDRVSPALRRLGVGRFIVPGRLRIGRLEELLELELEEGEFETVAGFVIDRLGRIPQAGEGVEHEGWRFVVLSVDANRVVEVLLERRPVPEPDHGEATP